MAEVVYYDQRLAGRDRDVYTQFGEDGLIKAVFQAIGTANRWCFEVGAADGKYYSNTLRLREQDWQSVLIESVDEQYEKLKTYESPLCQTIHEEATDLDKILEGCSAPVDLDLGVIDIDGQDYWLWHDMVKYKPRVMLVEFHWKDGLTYIPARGAASRLQAGPAAVMSLGADKGYTPVAQTHVNLLFVRSELWQSS